MLGNCPEVSRIVGLDLGQWTGMETTDFRDSGCFGNHECGWVHKRQGSRVLEENVRTLAALVLGG